MKFLPKLMIGFALGWGMGFLGAAFACQRIQVPADLVKAEADQGAAIAEILHPPQ